MEGEKIFQIKFTGDNNGNGEGVVVRPGESVRPAAVKEIVKGGNLNALLEKASFVEHTQVKPEVAPVGKKIEVTSQDELETVRSMTAPELPAAATENVEMTLARPENPVQKYRSLLNGVFFDFKNKLSLEIAERTAADPSHGDASGKALHYLEVLREDMDDVMDDGIVELIEETHDSEGEEARGIIIRTLQKKVKSLGNNDKGTKILLEAFKDLKEAENGKAVEQAAPEAAPENPEKKERQEQADVLFKKVFDIHNFPESERTVEVPGEKPYSIARAILVANYKTGAITKTKEAFLEQYAGGITEEEMLPAILAFCEEHLGEFAKKGLQYESLLAACGKFHAGPAEKNPEQGQEVAAEKFNEIESRIAEMQDIYALKILAGERRKVFKDKTAEAVAMQHRKLREATEGLGALLERFKQGERSAQLLAEYAKYEEKMAKLKNELFLDPETGKKSKKKQNESRKEKKAQEPLVSFDEYVERIKSIEGWRMKDVEAGKKLFPIMEREKFAGLPDDKVKVLRDMIAQAHGRLDAAVAQQELLRKEAEPDGWKEELQQAITQIEEVDVTVFDKLKVVKLEDLDLKKVMEDAAKKEWSIRPEDKSELTLEFAKKINANSYKGVVKSAVVFDGKTYLVEGEMDDEHPAHHEEVTDRFPQTDPGAVETKVERKKVEWREEYLEAFEKVATIFKEGASQRLEASGFLRRYSSEDRKKAFLDAFLRPEVEEYLESRLDSRFELTKERITEIVSQVVDKIFQ